MSGVFSERDPAIDAGREERIMLNTIVHGEKGAEPPLVIAHGLYGSARNWGVIARGLSAARQVIAVDMRNHGDSHHDPVHAYEEMAADLAEVIDAHGGRADVLGHSMGGKAAMVLALSEPARVGRLIVADIAPVEYSHSQIMHVEAMRRVDLSAVTRRSDADAQLATLSPDRALRAFFLQSLVVEPGGARWKLNLDALGDQMEEIMGFPPLDAEFDRPALFLRGGASEYVGDAHRPRILELFPAATFETIPGVGHWLHAEAPDAFRAAVSAFLDA
jgi:pimeloyl-ACP methyl ester carboxylesterase